MALAGGRRKKVTQIPKKFCDQKNGDNCNQGPKEEGDTLNWNPVTSKKKTGKFFGHSIDEVKGEKRDRARSSPRV